MDLTTIQSAINAASPGDYIFVFNGTYTENVVVNQSVWIIGERQDITIIDGGGAGTVVNVTAGNVVLSAFTIQNSGNLPEDAGIRLDGSTGSVINRNNLVNTNYSIYLTNSNANEILRNTGSSADFGLNLTNSNDNNIVFNVFKGDKVGIALSAGSTGNNITRNNVTQCTQFGVLADSGGNLFFHNNFLNNQVQVGTDSINTWDNGVVSGGNFWSNYTGVDVDHNGLGDTPQTIDASNADNFPLIRAANDTRLMTDLNDDRVTDMKDIGITAKAYGSTPGSTKWNFLADVNGDLKVNLKDISLTAANFMKTYP